MRHSLTFIILFLFGSKNTIAQVCTALGQTPPTAFPVCGTSIFNQTTVPICTNKTLFVPNCPGVAYGDKNPYYYKFTCFQSGTLGFTITPKDLKDDYDWQLYDITDLNPNDIYTNNNTIVTGNWAGNPGTTGTSNTGNSNIQCASSYTGTENRFAKMPQLTEGHTYLLMVSHFSDSQSGYNLEFKGGSAVITDTKIPKLQSIIPDCDGANLTLVFNKKMRCNSITALGTDFVLSPPAATVTRITLPKCNTGFDVDTVHVELSNQLPPGTYDLVAKTGSDGNTVLDICETPIAIDEKITFVYTKQTPIFADSVATPTCAPQNVVLFFPKNMDCSSIAGDGNDFSITGPSIVQIQSAVSKCDNAIRINFKTPIGKKGTYTLSLTPGIDGVPIRDECQIELLPQNITFYVAGDTVDASFNATTKLGCRLDTVAFSHSGNNDINSWVWKVKNQTINAQRFTKSFPANDTVNIALVVTNGFCKDTANSTIIFNNLVAANFNAPDFICPKTPLLPSETSIGIVDNYIWQYGNLYTFQGKKPDAYSFATSNKDQTVWIKLIVQNNSLSCADSFTKKLVVLNNCYIAVPSAFTPNGDGLNDFLYPNNAINTTGLVFKIFNRWGQMVFATNNPNKKWDGKLNNMPQAAGVYVWYLAYTHKETGKFIEEKGTTTLIR